MWTCLLFFHNISSFLYDVCTTTTSLCWWYFECICLTQSSHRPHICATIQLRKLRWFTSVYSRCRWARDMQVSIEAEYPQGHCGIQNNEPILRDKCSSLHTSNLSVLICSQPTLWWPWQTVANSPGGMCTHYIFMPYFFLFYLSFSFVILMPGLVPPLCVTTLTASSPAQCL